MEDNAGDAEVAASLAGYGTEESPDDLGRS
jgi:hypothetical protein